MWRKAIQITLPVFLLLVAASPAFAAQEEGVFLPGWFALLMVAISLIVPLGLLFFLKRNGRL